MRSSRLITSYKSEIRSLDPTKNYSDINLSAQNNPFGSIAQGMFPVSTSAGFIPLDSNGTILDIRDGYVNPQWLGLRTTSMQYWAYTFCSPLAAVIDRLAESDTNGLIRLIGEDKKPLKNYKKNPVLNRVMQLLDNPNPLQTWEEFNSQQIVLCKIFGYCPVFALCPAGLDKTYTKSLWNLNPFFCTPNYNNQFDIYKDDNSPIISWKVSIFGYNMEIPSSDIMLLKDGFVDTLSTNLSLPMSKIAGLDYAISNICAAMEADNVLLKKKGPLGVFSYDAKPDMAGWNPMTTTQQNEVQNDLKRYGMTWAQLQYIVSRVPIKWNSMSFNVQELMTKETVRQGIDSICDRLGFPAELMSGKNATYENRSSAEKYLYQNNVIPFSMRRMARYDKFFGITGLSQDFSYLPVLQDDILKAGEARKSKSQSLEIDWKNDMITRNEYRQELGMEPLGQDGELIYSEWIKKYPPEVKTKTKKEDAPTP
jgi:hypothetical protein